MRLDRGWFPLLGPTLGFRGRFFSVFKEYMPIGKATVFEVFVPFFFRVLADGSLHITVLITSHRNDTVDGRNPATVGM